MDHSVYRAFGAWVVVAALASALVLAVLGRADAQIDVVDGNASRGEQLYTADCTQCHASDGRGGQTPDGRPAPSVNDVSIAYARLVLRTHRMPPGSDPFDNRDRPQAYDEQAQADVLAYMTETFALDDDVEAPALGDPARGLELYQLNCAACHGASGQGGVAGGGAWTPRVNRYDAQVIADAIRVGPFEMPRFSSDALSDEEVGDIAAFLHEVAEEPGTLLFPGELNPVYASAFGGLLTVAVLALVLLVAGRPIWLPDEEDEEEVTTDD